jgi:hypothetical protein
VDESGRWALVFSPDDFGHLIGDRATSRRILGLWDTTPQAEIDGYVDDLSRPTAGMSDFERRVLAHAEAGRWGDEGRRRC